MSELEPTNIDSGGQAPQSRTSLLRRQAPYLAVLVLAIVGVAYSNAANQPLAGYWEFLAVVTGVMCVVTQWENAPDKNSRFRLIGKQALHWAAVLVAMNIMVLNRVQSVLPAPALSLVLLTLLALGTFLAGVNFLSLQIGFLGLALLLAVPAIAWLKQSFLFLGLAFVLIVGIAIAIWPSVTGGGASNKPGKL
jgi:hypothetical protein